MKTITETLHGGEHKVTFTSDIPGMDEYLMHGYINARYDIVDLGLEGALQKWHDEEAKERRKLGLKVKERY